MIVTVERGSTSSKGAQAGHVWLIRVANGAASTIIVTNLTAATANLRAEQLATIIGARFCLAPA